jgi:hypothetical protein
MLELDQLMAKMQGVLSALNFQWFHPDDMRLVARSLEGGMYLCVKVQRAIGDALRMNLYFTQATPSIVQVLLDSVKNALAAN